MPISFPYKHLRGTDDAINSWVHIVTKYLENPRAYAWLLFVDFSSAYNSHSLKKKQKKKHCSRWMSSHLLLRGSAHFFPIVVSRSGWKGRCLNLWLSALAPHRGMSVLQFCSHHTLMNANAVLLIITWLSSLIIQLF